MRVPATTPRRFFTTLVVSDVTRPTRGVRGLVAPVPDAERIERDDRCGGGQVRRREAGLVRAAERPAGELEHVHVQEVEEERRLPEDEERSHGGRLLAPLEGEERAEAEGHQSELERGVGKARRVLADRSEEHTSELQ